MVWHIFLSHSSFASFFALLLCFVFLAPVDDLVLTVQFNIYMFPSVCLEGGWLSCSWFAVPTVRSQLLKCYRPFEQSHLFEWAILLSDKLDSCTSIMCPMGMVQVCVCVCLCVLVCVCVRQKESAKRSGCQTSTERRFVVPTKENTLPRRELIAKLKGLCFYESALIIE